LKAALSDYVQASNSKQFDFGVLENIKFEVAGELYNSPRIHQQPKPKPPPKPQPKQTSDRYLEWLWDPEHSNSVITNNKGEFGTSDSVGIRNQLLIFFFRCKTNLGFKERIWEVGIYVWWLWVLEDRYRLLPQRDASC